MKSIGWDFRHLEENNMHTTISTHEGRVPVTALHVHGDLDASNYTELINKAQELYGSGARYLLVDLGNVPFLSSAGLIALHTVALIFAGENVTTNGAGRPSFRSLDPGRDQAARQHVKLLNPQPQVDQVLEQVFSDTESAIQSF
jgi:hypothetical protein